MKLPMLPAVTLSIAIAGLPGPVLAQTRTEPAGALFFEGDIVRHFLQGQQGPFCVLQNQFRRGEAVAWRIRVLRPTGEVAGDTVIKSVVVELGNGQRLPAKYGSHGDPPTDYFWSVAWTVPPNFPTGSLGYKVVATMQDDKVVTWEPFTRQPTQLTVIDGSPLMASATP